MKKLSLLFILFSFSLLADYEFDFDRQMGKGTDFFQHVKTQEDRHHLSVFRKYYHRNLQSSPSKGDARIPKIIHFVWCGPQSFSKKMLKNMHNWVQKHPDWKIKLWSDRKHRLPHPQMELCLIENFGWKHLGHKYKSTLNYAEREELFTFEILEQEGGVCIHPTVSCKNPFTQLNKDYDLYAFASKPHESCASSSIYIDPGVMGSIPHHPKIQKTIKKILSSWVEVEEAFGEDSNESYEYRMIYRTRLPINQIFEEEVDQPAHDIVFPAGFLYKINNNQPLLAQVKYVKKPFKGEISFEEKIDKQADCILRKEQKLLLMHLVLLGTLIAGFFVLFKKNYI